ncbi:hypothetical protein EHM69_00460 [candidate division KSB1 bacterium]|nr:MAG: hypothetical protein EHM69_00460 [candidate division KSB1 bacterium]
MSRFVLCIFLCLAAVSLLYATPIHTAIDSSNAAAVDSLLKTNPGLRDSANENGEPPLYYAAKTGKTDIVRMLLAKGVDAKTTNNEGTPATHIAAQRGNLATVRMLIEAGADPRALDLNNGGTALHWAADGGNCENIEYLFSLGLDIQNPDRATFTPLMRAASRGHKPAFDLLLAKGATLEVGTDLNNSVMAQAAGGGNIDIVNFLIAKGFDINARSSNSSAPIHVAVWRRQPEMVRYLITKGAYVAGVRNRFGTPILHSAAVQGDTVIAAILLANGSTVFDSSTGDGSTALHMAAQSGQLDMVRYLLDHSANVNQLDAHGGSALGWAVENNQMEAAELLIARGAIVNPLSCPEKFPCSQHLSSPLHRASIRSPRMVEFLLGKGGDPNGRDYDGSTPLIYSTWSDSIRCMEILLARGANPNIADSNRHTALYRVCQSGKLPQIELLLKNGADPNIADNDGITPLHIAAVCGFDTIAQKLISASADVNAKDELKHRPLYYAQYHGHSHLAEYLKSAGAKGGAKSVISDRDLLARELKDNEAVVWYLSHSGWAIKTKNHVLIIDYFPFDRSIPDASFANGCVNPDILNGMNVAVFASHEHQDHIHPEIFEWRKRVPGLQYYLGVLPEQVSGFRPDPADPVEYTRCRAGETISQDGISIRPIKSDIDQGCGFFIQVDGLTIFHPGDAVDTSRIIPSRYSRTVDSLAVAAKSVDMFFFPIRGCGFPDLEAVKHGIDYTISTLHPKVALPMHARNAEYELRNYAAEAKKRKANANYHCVRQPGERFFYSGGKVKPI